MPKHIFRLILLIVAVVAVAAIAAPVLTVDSFYRYGHYRANSVPEIAAREPVYQTPRYCYGCHTERRAQWSAGSHKSVICEVCHGAARGHPQSGKLFIPTDTVRLCTQCHEAMPGRPATQPQIEVAAHSGGQQCAVCHNPHSPKISIAAAKLSGDAARGRQSAEACAGCHGDEGGSPNDTWPNLAGQNAAYLVRILAAYQSGDQTDPVMTPLASGLSNADIQDLAAFYAGLSCKPTSGGKPVGNVSAGESLAANCVACHGQAGRGANPAWPKLAAQKPGYLVNVLKAFKAGLRKDPMMAGVAKNLSDTDIADLAAYYAAQSCQSTN
jgi:cytochrome c553